MPDAIAVRLPNWLGDTVMAVPALRALRAAHPAARVLLVGPWVSVLAGQGLAESLVTYPRAWAGRLAMSDAARRFGADVAVLLASSTEAVLAAWYWGARRRIGFSGGGHSLLLTDAVDRPQPRLHQIDEYLRLAEHAGGITGDRVPRLAPPDADDPARGETRALLREVGAREGRLLVGVHLGAAYGPAKVWPLERTAEFCRLAHAAGVDVVLLGAPGDAAGAARVAAAAPALSLVGRDRPPLLPALLTEVDALVSGDTGVAHLAAALGTRVITLFGPTDAALTAPRGAAASYLAHPVPCSPCFYRACPIEHPCLRSIDAAAVLHGVLGGSAVRA
ncbi:MAG: glycosyltransferase family 9 protein [Candidatus Rokuibacteriota bacterium]